MKKIILLIITLFISTTAVFALQDTKVKKDAYNQMIDSHKRQHEICSAVADNFRYDHQFAGYIRSKCIFYESDRQRLLNSVFVISSNNNTAYKNQYPVLMSEFAIKMNNNEIEAYKLIVNEYCKYNSYKFAKKDPQACSQERIESLFN